MKKSIVIICCILCFLAGICLSAVYANTIYQSESKTESEMDYYAYAESLDLIEITNANDLTAEELESRNGKLIIERVVGVVEDAETGAGRVLYSDPDYCYISYEDVEGIANGNVVCTYFIYNPDNNFVDDTIMRFDYIIETEPIY